ncbi:MAG: 6-phosphogluconolactonase [Chloroflexi bacterium]|nr:6-phosphogluconolactonase [Chloroflexota bacterium]
MAEEIIKLAGLAINDMGFFSIGLSGGRTPITLLGLLATTYSNLVPWSKIHFFWGDERCVPPDHPESNFGTALQTLISKVPIPSQNIHRIFGELEPSKAADAYEKDLRDFFFSNSERSYLLDLILLGIGRDGHTASLFPGDSVLQEQERWVAVVSAPSGVTPQWRITLTLPTINAASRAFFLVSGKEKQPLVHYILERRPNASSFPAALVAAKNGVTWFVDQAAWDSAFDPENPS